MGRPGFFALRMSTGSLLGALVYGLAGIGLLGLVPEWHASAPEPPKEAEGLVASPAGPGDLASLKAQLAEQLFCSCTPCPSCPEAAPLSCPETAAPPGLRWWVLVFVVGLLLGLACASCCCGACAGAIWWRGESQRDVRPRAIRAIAPGAIAW